MVLVDVSSTLTFSICPALFNETGKKGTEKQEKAPFHCCLLAFGADHYNGAPTDTAHNSDEADPLFAVQGFFEAGQDSGGATYRG